MLNRLILYITFSFLSCASWSISALEPDSWANILYAKSQYVEEVELIYWDAEEQSVYAKKVVQWFLNLPKIKQVFKNGKVIIAPQNNENNGVFTILQKMSLTPVSDGYKGIEGTAKKTKQWSPPFDNKPFVVISYDSITRYNAGLVHELLHHYYWGFTSETISEIEKIRDTFLLKSNEKFIFKDDPGHIFVYSCQYYPMGYGKIIQEHFPKTVDVCASMLGNDKISSRGTTTEGVDLWGANFVERNGMM